MISIGKTFKIAGTQYCDLKGFPQKLPINQAVILRHNPNNAFDKFAVECRVVGYMIGHIPRTELAVLHHLAKVTEPVVVITSYDSWVEPCNMFTAQILVPPTFVLSVPQVTFVQ